MANFRIPLLGCLMTVALTAPAQRPVASPPTSASVVIEGKKIQIDYGQPSMRGRKIMGGLVPYGEVWCAGANNQTTIITAADLNINGLKVPKGTYTLYTLPTEKEWKLIVNKQTGQWHTEYHEDLDLGRVPMTIKKASAPVEKMTFALVGSGGNKGTLSLAWESTEVSVPFTVLP